MRIGSFEIDCIFNPCFTLAEVCAGRARLLRSLSIRNVSGTARSWLNLRAEVNGLRTKRKAVRELGVGDEARARALEASIIEELTAPKDLGPGAYTAYLALDTDQGESSFPFSFEILEANVIPTDFSRAALLAAYVREDDALRAFAADALNGASGGSAASEAEGIYRALLEKNLVYQPPVNVKYADCQRISGGEYVIGHGGSCADLSLTLASLLWCRGHAPALVLYRDHMMAGCFADGRAPAFVTTDDAGRIAALIREGTLTLIEVTALCSYRASDFDQARLAALDRVEHSQEPCVLVNVQQALREKQAVTLPDVPRAAVRCPFCGFDRFPAGSGNAGEYCPACGQILPAPEKPVPSEEAWTPDVSGGSDAAYQMRRGEAVAVRLLNPNAAQARIAPSWQGHAVRRIAGRAFENAGVKRVLLSEGIVGVGEYAFYGCRSLEYISLPESLASMGSGAFCMSGLKSARVPGGVKRLPRMAYADCASLEKIDLCEGIEEIGERAFAGCPNLRQARIPASVKRIRRGAFDPECELLLASPDTKVER